MNEDSFPIGVWMHDGKHIGYRGGVVVLRFDKPTSSGMFYELSRCSSCEMKQLTKNHNYGKVISWLILPP